MNIRIDYNISELRDFINWIYFFHAWGLAGKPQAEKDHMRAEAERMLDMFESRYHTHAVFGLFHAGSDDDDLIVGNERIPMLRQQHDVQSGHPNLCLADFVRPISDISKNTKDGIVQNVNATQDNEWDVSSTVGIFATTVDSAMEHDFLDDDYERMLSQTLADRLAEATAEVMHAEVRRRYWGYAPDENLSVKELLREDYQGIRPAIGYPSLPDTSVNFIIDRLISMKDIGIRLTESGAMKPHASVSGLMFAHPGAHYFDLGKIDEQQLRDYARRRHLPIELARRFLASRLA